MNPCQVDATAETNGGHSTALPVRPDSNCRAAQESLKLRNRAVLLQLGDQIFHHHLLLQQLAQHTIDQPKITMEGHGGGDTWASMRDEYQPQTNPHPSDHSIHGSMLNSSPSQFNPGGGGTYNYHHGRQSFPGDLHNPPPNYYHPNPTGIGHTIGSQANDNLLGGGGHSTGTQGDGGHTYSNPTPVGHWAAMYLVIQMDCKAIAILQEGEAIRLDLKVVGAVPSQAPHPLGHWAAMVPLTAVVLVQSVPCESAPPAPHPLRNGTKAANSFPMTSALRVILIGNQPPVAAIQAGLANTPRLGHANSIAAHRDGHLDMRQLQGTPRLCRYPKRALASIRGHAALLPELDSYGRQSSLKNAGGKTPYALVKDALDAQSTGWLETNLSVKWREDGELVEKVEQASSNG
ncbi:hypothetical protein H4Q26_013717 [Puccinia striiformis f. sp. tritici PST-130]|nr:hypothetical protein H4Q26_013717 [Puccinia striiformis f. sp. tritici PST-130]